MTRKIAWLLMVYLVIALQLIITCFDLNVQGFLFRELNFLYGSLK